MPTETPLYRQFLDIAPPERFLRTLEAYMHYLLKTDRTWSGRRLMRESGLSHNYLSSLKIHIAQSDDYHPGVNTIDPIVAALNRHLPGEQRWPRMEALEAANVDLGEIADKTVQITEPRAVASAPTQDTFPQFPARLALPVLSTAVMEKEGLAAAANPRAVFQVMSNMALVKERIRDYAPQQEGDWALIQDPSVNLPDGVETWALIRDGHHLRAVPAREAPKKQIVAWILGVLRIVAD